MVTKKTLILVIISVFPFIYNASCADTCVINEVTLTDYWKETNQNTAIDPLGGYIFIYWIDANGNACHGEPGVSGQPGPLVIKAFSQDAYNAAQSNSFISQSQMKQYQNFIYANAGYHVQGLHFAQFDNVIWRNRSDGKVFIDRSYHSFSRPEIVNVEGTLCLKPIHASTDMSCGEYRGILVPNIPSSGQHPTIGLVKQLPLNQNMGAIELLSYCVTKLQQGLVITEF